MTKITGKKRPKQSKNKSIENFINGQKSAKNWQESKPETGKSKLPYYIFEIKRC